MRLDPRNRCTADTALQMSFLRSAVPIMDPPTRDHPILKLLERESTLLTFSLTSCKEFLVFLIFPAIAVFMYGE